MQITSKRRRTYGSSTAISVGSDLLADSRVSFRNPGVLTALKPSVGVLMLAGVFLLTLRNRGVHLAQRLRRSLRTAVPTAILCLGLLVTLTSTGWSQGFFFREDFDDSQFPENLLLVPPPGLVGIEGLGKFETRDGSYFIQPESNDHAWLQVTGVPMLPTIEVRARLLASPAGDTTFISLSNHNSFGDLTYYGGIFSTGISAGGWSTDSNLEVSSGSTRLVNTADWFTLRMDVGEDQLELRAWNDGDSVPTDAQWTFPTSRFDETLMNTGSLSYNLRNTTNRATLEVDYIQVTSAVPEPTGAVLMCLGLLCLVRRQTSRAS